jgi:tetratricopeptide (TPR) repeat protein
MTINPGWCLAGDQGDSWERLNQKALDLARAGDYKQARTMFESALGQISNSTHINDAETGVLLNNLGFVALESGDYKSAQMYLSQAIQLLTAPSAVDVHDVASAQENLGRLYWRKGQFERAQPLLLQALSLQERMSDVSAKYMATRFENLGRFFSQKGEPQAAEIYFDRALKLRRNSSSHDPELWKCLVDTADSCLLQGKNAQARTLLTEAQQLVEKQFGANSENATDLRARVKDAELNTYPKFEIIHPNPDEVVDSQPILVQIAVHDFELKTPQPQFGRAPGNKTGHIHYMLDDHPPVATSATQIMMEGGPAFLVPGEHTLWVELVDETHHPLAPPVRHRVKFQTN